LPVNTVIADIVEIRPHAADFVYVDVAEGGRLIARNAKAGQVVTRGQQLAVLENKDLDMEIVKLAAKEKEYDVRLTYLRCFSHSDRKSPDTIPQLEKALELVRQQRKQKENDRARLTLRASRDGTVLPPPPTSRTDEDERDGGQLPTWSGTPLDEENYRPFLKPGTLFCEVGDPRSLEAILAVDTRDIGTLKVGQEIDLRLDAFPNHALHGRIERISAKDLRIASRRLSTKSQSEVATKTNPETGAETRQSPSYQAVVPITDDECVMLDRFRSHKNLPNSSTECMYVFAGADGLIGELGTDVSGKPIEYGSLVKKGQPLIKISNSTLSAQEADIDGPITTEREHAIAIRHQLSSGGRLDTEDRARLMYELAESQEQVISLQAQAKVFQAMLADLEVRSPMDGQIATRGLKTRLKGRSVQRGQILLRIAVPRSASSSTSVSTKPNEGVTPVRVLGHATIHTETVKRKSESSAAP
jgi:multidrug resistance efflux pump